MKVLGNYKNGNVSVKLYDDGTKIRFTPEDEFHVEFPENFDLKITNQCPYACQFCHENSVPDGKHGDIMNAEFINKLHAGTEVAIGGGAITSHPDLVPFLEKLKSLGVVANATVNQREYQEHKELIEDLLDRELIHGLGLSYTHYSPYLDELVKKHKNVVIHLIAGIHKQFTFDKLSNINAKILILGYKDLRRGHDLLEKDGNIIQESIKWLSNNVMSYRNKFRTISFDNLALAQLDMKTKISEEDWNNYYQGEDGSQTMFIDLVEEKFSRMSTSPLNERYPIKDDIIDMFNQIRIDK